MTVSLVVEDGTGLALANCYVSAADVTAYCDAHALVGWTTDAAAQVTAILRATQYLENNYRGRWKGYRVKETQALAWPRSSSAPITFASPSMTRSRNVFAGGAGYLLDQDGYPILANVVPKAVKDASCELARLSAAGTDLLAAASDPAPAVKARKAGDTSEEYAGAVSTRPGSLIAIDRLLEFLLASIPGATFGNVPVIRG
jgi:hypothetical protein